MAEMACAPSVGCRSGPTRVEGSGSPLHGSHLCRRCVLDSASNHSPYRSLIPFHARFVALLPQSKVLARQQEKAHEVV